MDGVGFAAGFFFLRDLLFGFTSFTSFTFLVREIAEFFTPDRTVWTILCRRFLKSRQITYNSSPSQTTRQTRLSDENRDEVAEVEQTALHYEVKM